MKLKQRQYDKEQLNIIDFLAKSTGLLKETIIVLYNRGYDTKEKIQRFLNPGKHNFNSPYLLKGVDLALERLKTARGNAETVVVYGDYDVDGICSTTILYNALRDFGINAVTVIPERANGYGLSERVIDEVVETYFPDLIITVDCGISCASEVEYLKDLGVDIIVTDHHEIPEILPDCITINCKIKEQDYPFENLCGAGVAYKLASALIGETADKFLDLVALATIADSMPLVDENRDLVFEGLKIIKNGEAILPLKTLMTVSGIKDITASSLAYTVAPRINAAGRMGDVYSALKLFTSTSLKEIDELSNKLSKYNIQRQAECEFLYKSAKEYLRTGGNFGNVIVLCGDDWNNGLIGITSAKIAEEYHLPTIIISGNGEVYHGSARSIDSINIYEAISNCKEYLIDFGGHSQAAGITISKENIIPFAEKLNEYIGKTYTSSDFEKRIEIDGVISSKFTMRLGREINLLEPFGVGNKRPTFATVVENVNAYPVKMGSNHVTFSNEIMDFMYFNGVGDIDVLNSTIQKTLLFEPYLTYFNGKEYLKGYVRNFTLLNTFDASMSEKALSIFFKNLKTNNIVKRNSLKKEEIQNLINEVKPNGFGTLIIVNNPENLKYYSGLDGFEKSLFRLNITGGKNALLIAGDNTLFNSKEYKRIISLDGYCFINNEGVEVYSSSLKPFNFTEVKVEREEFKNVYKRIINFINTSGSSYDNLYDSLIKNYSKEQVVLCFEVFNELGFITFDKRVMVNNGVKKDLFESKIFTNSKKLIEGYDNE